MRRLNRGGFILGKFVLGIVVYTGEFIQQGHCLYWKEFILGVSLILVEIYTGGDYTRGSLYRVKFILGVVYTGRSLY